MGDIWSVCLWAPKSDAREFGVGTWCRGRKCNNRRKDRPIVRKCGQRNKATSAHNFLPIFCALPISTSGSCSASTQLTRHHQLLPTPVLQIHAKLEQMTAKTQCTTRNRPQIYHTQHEPSCAEAIGRLDDLGLRFRYSLSSSNGSISLVCSRCSRFLAFLAFPFSFLPGRF
jgi:hypothetical protein